MLEKAKLGQEVDEYVDYPQTSADFEQKIAAKKLNKLIVNKLLHT